MDSSRQTTSLCKDTGDMHRIPPAVPLPAAPTLPKALLSDKLNRNFPHTEMLQKRDLFCFPIPSHVWGCTTHFESFASGFALERRQNIMTSLLLHIFYMPRNRNHQGYTPPHALIAIYSYPNSFLQFITSYFLITKTWQQRGCNPACQCASRWEYRPLAMTLS